MLSTLHIENIAVIELADIEFEPGLNLLTGETGAGKSMIVDALGAVLGMRTSRELIRTGHQTARVSALFDMPCETVRRFVSENGCGEGDELLISRELRADGRSTCRVNGNPVTAALLKELGALLINIHGQHDNQALAREDTHQGFLDSFGSVDTAEYRACYEAWRALEKERKALQMDEEEKARRVDMLSYRLREWEELALEEGEEEALSARRTVLRDSGRISAALGEAYGALYGDEDNAGAVDLTATAQSALGGIAGKSETFAHIEERLGELRYALADYAGEISSLWEDIEGSENELEGIETRLDAIHRLCRKHNTTAEGLWELAEGWQNELDRLVFSEERLRTLEGETRAAYDRVCKTGEKLRAVREKAARTLEERMKAELGELDMRSVRFAVLREACEPGPEGMDTVRFLISTNKGEELRPLAKVASGGEMSRIMLALKNLLVGGDELCTLVFDEVDSGVSGQAAQRVARKLCAVSRRKQVLCITHLPQIAAAADSHFRIEKEEVGERTVTRVTKLDRAGRIEELARINAGAQITETTRRSAGEMLEQAEEMKREVR